MFEKLRLWSEQYARFQRLYHILKVVVKHNSFCVETGESFVSALVELFFPNKLRNHWNILNCKDVYPKDRDTDSNPVSCETSQ